MQQKLNWQAYANNDRNIIIGELKEAIDASDGCIINFNMFSDLAITISIEIGEHRILELHEALSGILELTDIKTENINLDSKREWLIFLNVAFSRGKGSLIRKIPAVPG